jgi:hypothetical protein
LQREKNSYCQVGDAIAIIDNVSDFKLHHVVKIEQVDLRLVEEIAEIVKKARSEEKKSPKMIILETPFNSFKSDCFSRLERYSREEENILNYKAYYFTFKVLSSTLVNNSRLSNSYFIIEQDKQEMSPFKPYSDIIQELDDNFRLNIIIEEDTFGRLIKNTQSNLMKNKNKNLRYLLDANAIVGIISSLHNKKVNDVRINSPINKENVIDALVALFSANLNILDIRLMLDSKKDVIRIFESLKNNYVIISLVLLTPTEVDDEVIEIAEAFRNKRIGLTVSLNTQH